VHGHGRCRVRQYSSDNNNNNFPLRCRRSTRDKETAGRTARLSTKHRKRVTKRRRAEDTPSFPEKAPRQRTLIWMSGGGNVLITHQSSVNVGSVCRPTVKGKLVARLQHHMYHVSQHDWQNEHGNQTATMFFKYCIWPVSYECVNYNYAPGTKHTAQYVF